MITDQDDVISARLLVCLEKIEYAWGTGSQVLDAFNPLPLAVVGIEF